ncbi:hypothetical protein PIB30_084473 [Stylosanthes scabra]|uniref:Reverse transcriptase domain-containing protein n=1 Tax=Stylosanthes scabra TaxID=79078 RepID=A0ABU6ZR80_9FABA|nr:hypothetical protein [Stylosanthes scabra]
MVLVKDLREDTPFLKSLTKRPPKILEEIRERSHDYLQQEEGQTTVRTDRHKKETSRKDLPREYRNRREQRSSRTYYNPLNVSLTTFLHEVSQVERVPAPRAMKNNNRGDRNAYCKYHKQNDHDTEDCRDLLEFVEKGLKKGKFREYTGRSGDQRDNRRTRAAKRSKQSCLAVVVMPRTLHDRPPPEITFSSEEVRRTTDTLNHPLVISMDVIDATIQRVFIDQGSSADILFRRCFDALGLTDKDLESHSDELVGLSG